MELEFDVKVTPGILYDYMLHHTYTSASGLIGTAVGVLMLIGFFAGFGVVFLVAGLVIIAYLPWTLFLRSRQQAANTPAFGKPLHYRLTDEGIEVSQDGEVQSQEWENMVRAVSTPSSIVVYTTPVNASIFPKRDMGDLTPKVVEMISTHMPPKKVKIRGW